MPEELVTPSPMLLCGYCVEYCDICAMQWVRHSGNRVDDCGHGVVSCGLGDGDRSLEAPSGMASSPVSTSIMPALPSVQEHRQQLADTIRQLQDMISTLGSPYTKMFAATVDAENPFELLEAVANCAKRAKNAVQSSTVELPSSIPAQQLQVSRRTCSAFSNALRCESKGVVSTRQHRCCLILAVSIWHCWTLPVHLRFSSVIAA